MYRGKHMNGKQISSRRRPLKWNRSFVLVLAVVMLVVGVVGGSLAYLVDNTGAVENTFIAAKVTCTINEPGWKDGNEVKENVTVTNTGDTDAYIRSAIVATWVDADGHIASSVPVSGTDYNLLIGADWTQADDGYYYYNQSVDPYDPDSDEDTTSPLIISVTPVHGKAPDGYTLCIDIIADAIQSNLGDNAQAAWTAAAK